MKKILKNISIVLLFGYVGMGMLLYMYQRDFIYFPTQKVKQPYPEVTFIHENESLQIIIVNQGQKEAVIYFGGNSEAVGLSSQKIGKYFPHHTSYLVNYRGYGGSTGVPTEEGIYGDALALYDEIKTKHQKISVAGRSLGSGVASYLASQRTVDKLALITPYDSIESIAQERFPMYPMSILLKDKYSLQNYLEKSSVNKILILLAEDDKVIPYHHSQKLIHSLHFMKVKVVTIKGAGHNNISNDERYYEVLRTFFGKMTL